MPFAPLCGPSRLEANLSCLCQGSPRNQICRVHDEFSSLIANQRAVVQAYEDLNLESKIAPFHSFILCVHDSPPFCDLNNTHYAAPWRRKHHGMECFFSTNEG